MNSCNFKIVMVLALGLFHVPTNQPNDDHQDQLNTLPKKSAIDYGVPADTAAVSDSSSTGPSPALVASVEQVNKVQAEVAVVTTDVTVLNADVALLNTSVSTLTTDVGTLTTDVSNLNTQVTGLTPAYAYVTNTAAQVVNNLGPVVFTGGAAIFAGVVFTVTNDGFTVVAPGTYSIRYFVCSSATGVTDANMEYVLTVDGTASTAGSASYVTEFATDGGSALLVSSGEVVLTLTVGQTIQLIFNGSTSSTLPAFTHNPFTNSSANASITIVKLSS